MTKNQIVTDIAENCNVPKKTVSLILEDFAQLIGEELVAGRPIAFPELGKFTPKIRNARQGRNPRTGETINIPAKQIIRFRPAKEITDNLKPVA